MSHSNKYYQLIKALRRQKHENDIHKRLRVEKLDQLKIRDQSLTPDKISSIIDLDNSIEMEEKDTISAKALQVPDEEEVDQSRLWNEFKDESLTLGNTDKLLPIHKKLYRVKDEVTIDRIIEDSVKEIHFNNQKVEAIHDRLKTQWQDINRLKDQLISYQEEILVFDKQLTKLKQDFDAQDKKLNQRSNKFKEERSKDMMIRNINKEDMEMRKAMASRIRLNQQLDMGFQMQRRRTFNQAKNAINQKKKVKVAEATKVRKQYDVRIKREAEIGHEKTEIKAHIEALEREIVCFLKYLIKSFKHSKGIQWMIQLVIEHHGKINKEDLPGTLPTQDKEFVTELTQERLSAKKTMAKTTTRGVNAFKGTHRRFKTDSQMSPAYPSSRNSNPRQYPLARPPPRLRRDTYANYYYDYETDNSPFRTEDSVQRPKFFIETDRLKDVYQNTGKVISKYIKRNNWSSQSHMMMPPDDIKTNRGNEQQQEAEIIEEKLKKNFTNVRQNIRKSRIKKLLLGDNVE